MGARLRRRWDYNEKLSQRPEKELLNLLTYAERNPFDRYWNSPKGVVRKQLVIVELAKRRLGVK